MIIGTGIDIIEVERIRDAIEKWGDGFLTRIFTEQEIECAQKRRDIFQHLASRFAAKEAVVKAFANGGQRTVYWKDIEVSNDKNGKPFITLYGRYSRLMQEQRVSEIIVSISHTKEHAVSTVLLVGDDKSHLVPRQH